MASLLGVAGESVKAAEKSGRTAFGMNARRAAHNLRAEGLITNGNIGGFEIGKPAWGAPPAGG